MTEPQTVRTPSWMILDPDERVVLRTSPSTNLLMAGIVVGFFFIVFVSLPFVVVGAVNAGRQSTFAAIGLVLLTVLLLFFWINNREYAVTTKRISVASGLISKDVRSIDIEEVNQIELEQDRWHRLLSVGTLQFVAGSDSYLTFSLVESPQFIYEQALDLV